MIASAFPGLFSIGALAEMGTRELQLWYSQATVKTLSERLMQIENARIAQAADADYSRAVRGLRDRIGELVHDAPRESVVSENWSRARKVFAR